MHVTLVEHAVRYLGGKPDFYLSLAKSLLVSFVLERTSKNHHKSVSDLLSVMLGLQYGEVEHRVWYSTYLDRLHNYRPATPNESFNLQGTKQLLEIQAARFYRMDCYHSAKQFLRAKKRTVSRNN